MKVPKNIINTVNEKLEGLEFGHVSLDVYVRHGKQRYEVMQKTSFYDEPVKEKDVKEDNE